MPWPKGKPVSPESLAKRVATFMARGRKRKLSRNVGGVDCWECPTCGYWLPAEQFYRKAGNHNGLSSQCRKCHTSASIRTRDPERARATNRAYMRRARQRNPIKFQERERAAAAAREKNQHTRARQLLNAAVRDGAVVKPEACSRCGAGGKLHGHHHDYRLPLDVVWLCPPCHGEVHRKTDAGRYP